MTTFDPLPPIRKARMYPDGPELNVMLAEPVQLWANSAMAKVEWHGSTLDALYALYFHIDGKNPLGRAELKSAMSKAFDVLWHYGLINDEGDE